MFNKELEIEDAEYIDIPQEVLEKMPRVDPASLIPSESLIPQTPVEKKPALTVAFDNRSPFTPPGFIFVGIGNIQKKYEDWLNKAFKEHMDALGQRENKKGNVSAKFIQAVSFIRALIYIAKASNEHESLNYKYQGVKFPRPLDMGQGVKKLMESNKDLLIALAPYYLPSETPNLPQEDQDSSN